MRTIHSYLLIALGAAGCTAGTSSVEQEGATFTTTEDGAAVNENHYTQKEAVYLDGGPGPNAPSSAAALDAGDYYFQVTDPSGKTLLSSDDLECRRFHIDDSGVIDAVIGACAHDTGVSFDHGGLTVQLFPFEDTPNDGGVYKVWVTPTDKIGEDGEFVNRFSKTDNFKVGALEDHDCPPEPVCGDGHVDPTAGEECDDSNTSDGDGCDSACKIEHVEECPSSC
jgi:cysteine-rich repeat protein